MASRLLWGALAIVAVVAASWFSGLGSLSNTLPATGDLSPVKLAQPAESIPTLSPKAEFETDLVNRHSTLAPIAELTGEITQTFWEARMDGRLWVGPDGHLIVDRALRQWFDSWLSLQGEWSLDQILLAMQAQFETLDEPASAEVAALLQRYLDYREALGQYDDRTGRSVVQSDADVLAQRLEWVERLRREFFDETVAVAFFGADETLDRHLLARRQLQQNGASEADIQALEQSLPPELQSSRQKSHALRNMHRQEQVWQAQGLDADTLEQQKYEYRTRQWGEAAAKRLASLDQQHQDWQQRLDDYAQYRNRLLEGEYGTDLSDENRDALNRWLQQHFSEQEQRRVPAALALYLSQ
ncbi:MAG: hypothetical protein CMI09_15205 [Oceanospirillaceae bacterium]|nr:hypothetical protein [Oceanospirillaceae bacterium]